MGGGCTNEDGRPSLSESVEALAHRAHSRGAVRRAGDLRAVAEHLRAKEARRDVVDVRPEALARHRRRAARWPRLREALRRAGARVRRLVTR
jgi:hypothetical protein